MLLDENKGGVARDWSKDGRDGKIIDGLKVAMKNWTITSAFHIINL